MTPEMATDGKFLYYNSIHICRLFKTSPQLVCRDYLHLTLHCIFRHLFVGEKLNGELWDLACDIAVEHLITGLGIKSLYAERQEKQSWLTDKLKEQMPRLTAERIYRYLVEQDLPPPGGRTHPGSLVRRRSPHMAQTARSRLRRRSGREPG